MSKFHGTNTLQKLKEMYLGSKSGTSRYIELTWMIRNPRPRYVEPGVNSSDKIPFRLQPVLPCFPVPEWGGKQLYLHVRIDRGGLGAGMTSGDRGTYTCPHLLQPQPQTQAEHTGAGASYTISHETGGKTSLISTQDVSSVELVECDEWDGMRLMMRIHDRSVQSPVYKEGMSLHTQSSTQDDDSQQQRQQ